MVDAKELKETLVKGLNAEHVVSLNKTSLLIVENSVSTKKTSTGRRRHIRWLWSEL